MAQLIPCELSYGLPPAPTAEEQEAAHRRMLDRRQRPPVEIPKGRCKLSPAELLMDALRGRRSRLSVDVASEIIAAPKHETIAVMVELEEAGLARKVYDRAGRGWVMA